MTDTAEKDAGFYTCPTACVEQNHPGREHEAWLCEPIADHHPNCYQKTGVPTDFPADICDCRTLRMIDAHYTRVIPPGESCHLCDGYGVLDGLEPCPDCGGKGRAIPPEAG